MIIAKWTNSLHFSCLCCSFDVRGKGLGIGRHWNDGVSLGPRARFEESAKPLPLLWIEDLREADGGTYRCRVDFKQAPTKNSKINLQVIGRNTQFYPLSLHCIAEVLCH